MGGKLSFKFQIVVVKKEKYVWLMEMPQQEEWKFVSVVSGVWCVITTGISEMPELLAKNLDFHSIVSDVLNSCIPRAVIYFYIVPLAIPSRRVDQME